MPLSSRLFPESVWPVNIHVGAGTELVENVTVPNFVGWWKTGLVPDTRDHGQARFRGLGKYPGPYSLG